MEARESMRVFIAGVDGYLGWPLAQHLVRRGHQVAGMDCYLRRKWVAEMGGCSAIPIQDMATRRAAFAEAHGTPLAVTDGDLCDYNALAAALDHFKPDAIVHLAQMPSAPFSMMDVHHAVQTHQNNLVGTLNLLFAMRDICPQAHLVKLGTMGEYGTPNLDIPEGFFEVEYRGRKDRLPFPRQPGSFYHLTKVHDSANVQFACRIWGLKATDIMQGVVFGSRIDAMGGDDRLLTRFDVDQCFGTAVNRFCAQAVLGRPLTPYGKGGQKRGFLPLRDSIQCFTLIIENPPADGEYRVVNQFEETYCIRDIASKVAAAADDLGLNPVIRAMDNPRLEMEDHYYNPDNATLHRLGYQPTQDMAGEIRVVLGDLLRFRDQVGRAAEASQPDIRWDGSRRPSGFL